ncbi:MAG: hypothetical protein WBA46_17125 [Thermomicrobiales bacterium]
MFVSFVPAPVSGRGPAGLVDVMEFSRDATFLDAIERLGASPASGLSAMFGLRPAGTKSGEVRDVVA